MSALITNYHLENLSIEELFSLHARLSHEIEYLPRHSIERVNTCASRQNVEREIAKRQSSRSINLIPRI